MVEELVDIVDDDDNVITTVTRAEMRARTAAASFGRHCRDVDRWSAVDPSPQPR